MTSEELKALQAPLKQKYRDYPATALQTMSVVGLLSPGDLTCRITSAAGSVAAGLHPAAGGPGTWACSADMMLEALVACAGVTLTAVATAMNIAIRAGDVTATGNVDFQGTLGVSKQVPIGFQGIALRFRLDADATNEQLASLIKLTERYCVVAQSLKSPTTMTIELVDRAVLDQHGIEVE